MTIQEKISLIWQFNGCKTKTYLELQQISSPQQIRIALLGDESTTPLIALKTSDFPGNNGEMIPMFHSGEAIRCRMNNTNFRDNDIFCLTEDGEDFLYTLKREQLSSQKIDETIKWAKYATWAGATSAIAAVASIIIG